jgi:hypothetical protein
MTSTGTGANGIGQVDHAPATPAARRPLFRHPWRVAIVAIALIAVLNLGAILVSTMDTRPSGKELLPNTIETISPERADVVGPIVTITVDLRDDLTGRLVVDGVPVPDDQLDRVEELGIVSFRPGTGKELTKLPTGDNTVVVYYWPRTRTEPARPPSYGWRFAVKA